jgi:formylglycine-generating enzyme required for sulfatase activity
MTAFLRSAWMLCLLSGLGAFAGLSALGANANEQTARKSFRDCLHCPLMMGLPAGRLVPSVYPLQDGRMPPSHPVQVPAFAIGIYDVTRDEYAAFVRETKRQPDGGTCQTLGPDRWMDDQRASWRTPTFPQTGSDPVVCVSWLDAQAYVRWLNTKIVNKAQGADGPYRLLSGNEWEYAARAGSDTLYYWGTKGSHDFANYGLEQCGPCGLSKVGKDRWDFTSPVGSFAPNAFGLYDMLGNVWQWTDECFQGDCKVRFLRGGSFNDSAVNFAMPSRNPYPIAFRNYANGFRIARSLD